ncbi:MAG TPA: hypothetical protein VNR36_11400 [Pseudolysinimonas sp.]|nr:hypothetical protein [Pseudolysinimonas sp.]
MGQLQYGTTQRVELDDRLLGHIEAAIISKLRRGEAFALRLDEAGVTATVWVSTGSQLQFTYSGERPTLDRAWLEALVETANTPSGLRLLPAP